MNDEKLIENKVETGASGVSNEEHSLRGKIARLPHAVREQLNRRLHNGEAGSVILPWLNGLPAVKRLLKVHFGGAEINEPNLTGWRQVGFKRWQANQEKVARVRGLVEDAEALSKTTGGRMARAAARMAVVKLFSLLDAVTPEKCTPAELSGVCHAIAALLKVEQNNEWLEHDKTRVALSNEHMTLRWDIQQRDVVKVAFRVLDDEVAKKIHASPYSNEEKFEMMGHCLYGDLWQGREIQGRPKGEKEGLVTAPKLGQNHAI